MGVDECISAYTEFMAAVFDEKLNGLPISLLKRVQSQRDSKKLKYAIEVVVARQDLSPTDRFNDGKPCGCKV